MLQMVFCAQIIGILFDVLIKKKHFFQNSIRHNLSLHSRFVRVQNEGSGKSSWWMLNPEAAKQAPNNQVILTLD